MIDLASGQEHASMAAEVLIMLTGNWWWIALAVTGSFLLLSTSQVTVSPPKVVDNVDLERYTGRWYSIAHIPTTFERGCAAGTTATYELSLDGKIEVVNECYNKQGLLKVARGKAWIPNPQQPAKLKVSFVQVFGVSLFAGDYWIIDLAPDYSYAVVGHPTRKYGWVLSRTPTLPEDKLQEIKSSLQEQGYDWSHFQLIDQSVHAAGGS